MAEVLDPSPGSYSAIRDDFGPQTQGIVRFYTYLETCTNPDLRENIPGVEFGLAKILWVGGQTYLQTGASYTCLDTTDITWAWHEWSLVFDDGLAALYMDGDLIAGGIYVGNVVSSLEYQVYHPSYFAGAQWSTGTTSMVGTGWGTYTSWGGIPWTDCYDRTFPLRMTASVPVTGQSSMTISTNGFGNIHASVPDIAGRIEDIWIESAVINDIIGPSSVDPKLFDITVFTNMGHSVTVHYNLLDWYPDWVNNYWYPVGIFFNDDLSAIVSYLNAGEYISEVQFYVYPSGTSGTLSFGLSDVCVIYEISDAMAGYSTFLVDAVSYSWDPAFTPTQGFEESTLPLEYSIYSTPVEANEWVPVRVNFDTLQRTGSISVDGGFAYSLGWSYYPNLIPPAPLRYLRVTTTGEGSGVSYLDAVGVAGFNLANISCLDEYRGWEVLDDGCHYVIPRHVEGGISEFYSVKVWDSGHLAPLATLYPVASLAAVVPGAYYYGGERLWFEVVNGLGESEILSLNYSFWHNMSTGYVVGSNLETNHGDTHATLNFGGPAGWTGEDAVEFILRGSDTTHPFYVNVSNQAGVALSLLAQDGYLRYLSSGGAYVDFATPMSLLTWVEYTLRMEFDCTTELYSIFVNGQLAGADLTLLTSGWQHETDLTLFLDRLSFNTQELGVAYTYLVDHISGTFFAANFEIEEVPLYTYTAPTLPEGALELNATETFAEYPAGFTPSGRWEDTSNAALVQVVESADVFASVLEFQDYQGGTAQARYDLASWDCPATGEVEFWVMGPDAARPFYITLGGEVQDLVALKIADNSLRYQVPGESTWTDLEMTIEDGTWYRLNISFDCSAIPQHPEIWVTNWTAPYNWTEDTHAILPYALTGTVSALEFATDGLQTSYRYFIDALDGTFNPEYAYMSSVCDWHARGGHNANYSQASFGIERGCIFDTTVRIDNIQRTNVVIEPHWWWQAGTYDYEVRIYNATGGLIGITEDSLVVNPFYEMNFTVLNETKCEAVDSAGWIAFEYELTNLGNTPQTFDLTLGTTNPDPSILVWDLTQRYADGTLVPLDGYVRVSPGEVATIIANASIVAEGWLDRFETEVTLSVVSRESLLCQDSITSWVAVRDDDPAPPALSLPTLNLVGEGIIVNFDLLNEVGTETHLLDVDFSGAVDGSDLGCTTSKTEDSLSLVASGGSSEIWGADFATGDLSNWAVDWYNYDDYYGNFDEFLGNGNYIPILRLVPLEYATSVVYNPTDPSSAISNYVGLTSYPFGSYDDGVLARLYFRTPDGADVPFVDIGTRLVLGSHGIGISGYAPNPYLRFGVVDNPFVPYDPSPAFWESYITWMAQPALENLSTIVWDAMGYPSSITGGYLDTGYFIPFDLAESTYYVLAEGERADGAFSSSENFHYYFDRVGIDAAGFTLQTDGRGDYDITVSEYQAGTGGIEPHYLEATYTDLNLQLHPGDTVEIRYTTTIGTHPIRDTLEVDEYLDLQFGDQVIRLADVQGCTGEQVHTFTYNGYHAIDHFTLSGILEPGTNFQLRSVRVLREPVVDPATPYTMTFDGSLEGFDVAWYALDYENPGVFGDYASYLCSGNAWPMIYPVSMDALAHVRYDRFFDFGTPGSWYTYYSIDNFGTAKEVAYEYDWFYVEAEDDYEQDYQRVYFWTPQVDPSIPYVDLNPVLRAGFYTSAYYQGGTYDVSLFEADPQYLLDNYPMTPASFESGVSWNTQPAAASGYSHWASDAYLTPTSGWTSWWPSDGGFASVSRAPDYLLPLALDGDAIYGIMEPSTYQLGVDAGNWGAYSDDHADASLRPQFLYYYDRVGTVDGALTIQTDGADPGDPAVDPDHDVRKPQHFVATTPGYYDFAPGDVLTVTFKTSVGSHPMVADWDLYPQFSEYVALQVGDLTFTLVDSSNTDFNGWQTFTYTFTETCSVNNLVLEGTLEPGTFLQVDAITVDRPAWTCEITDQVAGATTSFAPSAQEAGTVFFDATFHATTAAGLGTRPFTVDLGAGLMAFTLVQLAGSQYCVEYTDGTSVLQAGSVEIVGDTSVHFEVTFTGTTWSLDIAGQPIFAGAARTSGLVANLTFRATHGYGLEVLVANAVVTWTVPGDDTGLSSVDFFIHNPVCVFEDNFEADTYGLNPTGWTVEGGQFEVYSGLAGIPFSTQYLISQWWTDHDPQVAWTSFASSFLEGIVEVDFTCALQDWLTGWESQELVLQDLAGSVGVATLTFRSHLEVGVFYVDCGTAQGTTAFTAGVGHELRVEIDEGLVTVTIDGTVEHAGIPASAGAVERVQLEVLTDRGQMAWDNFRVYSNDDIAYASLSPDAEQTAFEFFIARDDLLPGTQTLEIVVVDRDDDRGGDALETRLVVEFEAPYQQLLPVLTTLISQGTHDPAWTLTGAADTTYQYEVYRHAWDGTSAWDVMGTGTITTDGTGTGAVSLPEVGVAPGAYTYRLVTWQEAGDPEVYCDSYVWVSPTGFTGASAAQGIVGVAQPGTLVLDDLGFVVQADFNTRPLILGGAWDLGLFTECPVPSEDPFSTPNWKPASYFALFEDAAIDWASPARLTLPRPENSLESDNFALLQWDGVLGRWVACANADPTVLGSTISVSITTPGIFALGVNEVPSILPVYASSTDITLNRADFDWAVAYDWWLAWVVSDYPNQYHSAASLYVNDVLAWETTDWLGSIEYPADFEPCSAIDLSGYWPGEYTFRLVASDGITETEFVQHVTILNDAPTLTSPTDIVFEVDDPAPPSLTWEWNDDYYSVGHSSGELGIRDPYLNVYRSVDGGAPSLIWEECAWDSTTSSIEDCWGDTTLGLSGLAVGVYEYTIEVYDALDPAGVGAVATDTVTVTVRDDDDTDPPVIESLTVVTNPTEISLEIIVDAYDASGIASIAVTIGGGALISGSSFQIDDPESYRVGFSTYVISRQALQMIIPGTYDVQVTVTDADGDTSTDALSATASDTFTITLQEALNVHRGYVLDSYDQLAELAITATARAAAEEYIDEALTTVDACLALEAAGATTPEILAMMGTIADAVNLAVAAAAGGALTTADLQGFPLDVTQYCLMLAYTEMGLIPLPLLGTISNTGGRVLGVPYNFAPIVVDISTPAGVAAFYEWSRQPYAWWHAYLQAGAGGASTETLAALLV